MKTKRSTTKRASVSQMRQKEFSVTLNSHQSFLVKASNEDAAKERVLSHLERNEPDTPDCHYCHGRGDVDNITTMMLE